MPTVYALLPEPKRAFLDSNGDPASGYQLFIYTAGSSTKATTYTESDGNTANSNPVVLDSRGEPPSGIYVESGTYKLVLATDTDTDPPSSAIWTRDNVSPINDTSTTVDQFTASGLTPTFVGSTSFTLVGDQRSTFHIGRRLKTSNSGGTGYHTITNSTFSSPNTTVTVANDSTALDAGLSSVSLSILTADSTSSLPGVEVSEDDWTHQGNVTVEGTLAVTGAATLSSTLAVTGVLTAGTAPLPRSWLAGLTLSNGTDTAHDIDIAAGAARDSTDAADLRLSSPLTKAVDGNWAEGDGAGFPSGLTLTADTWYRTFVIGKTDGTVDGGYDTSASAANLLTDATGYTLYRRIGWARTYTGTGPDLRQFAQHGDEFYWLNPDQLTLDVNGTTIGTSESTLTINNAPPGSIAILNVSIRRASEAAEVRIYPTDVADAAVASNSAPLPTVGGFATSSSANPIAYSSQMQIRLDSSQQIHARASTTGVTLYALAVGWIDRRGRDD